MTVLAVGVVIQLETDTQSSTVPVYFLKFQPTTKHQVVKAIVNTVFRPR